MIALGACALTLAGQVKLATYPQKIVTRYKPGEVSLDCQARGYTWPTL